MARTVVPCSSRSHGMIALRNWLQTVEGGHALLCGFRGLSLLFILNLFFNIYLDLNHCKQVQLLLENNHALHIKSATINSKIEKCAN